MNAPRQTALSPDPSFAAEVRRLLSGEADDGDGDADDEVEEPAVPKPVPVGMIGCLNRLVAGFDDEWGQCEDVYAATVGLLRHVYGEWVVAAFCTRMDGCDGRSFFRHGGLELFLRDLAAGKPLTP